VRPGEHDRDDVANVAVELVAGAGGRGLVERGRPGTLKERIEMMNSSMGRRLRVLEAQVTSATQTAEQRAAQAEQAMLEFWHQIVDLGHRLQRQEAPTVERLNGASAISLVARLVVPGPVPNELVLEAIRRRVAWLEQRGEGEEAGTVFLRRVVALEEGDDTDPVVRDLLARVRAHEAATEGEDRHEQAHG
jgi:hypothetical protein